MRIRYVITIVFAAALIAVVLSSALYINWVNANIPPKPDLDVQFVYAYLTQPTENIAAGLTYGNSEVREGYNTTSYVMILKVTNRGTEMASMTQIGAVLAEHITENAIGLNDTHGNPAKGNLGGPSFGISNILIADQRAAMSTVGSSNRIEEKETRLIALTGVISLNKFDQQYLQRENYGFGAPSLRRQATLMDQPDRDLTAKPHMKCRRLHFDQLETATCTMHF